MVNILQFPKREFKIGHMKFLHKLYYIEESDTLWTSMQDTKTGEWGEWVMISEGFLLGKNK